MLPKGILLVLFTAGGVLAQGLPQTTIPRDHATAATSLAARELPDAPSATRPAPGDPVEKNVIEAKRTRGTPTLADPYVPLTSDEKFKRWVHSTYSPYTFSSALFSAGLSQAAGDWREYGGGMQGFGKRFGASLAETESSGFFKVFLLPTLLNQDPRYFAMRTGGVKRRVWYATTRVLVARKDDGGNTFNASEVMGTLFVQSLQNAWVPRANRGFDDTMSGTAGALVSDAGSNLLREFWPDISRIFHKHEPASIKKIENKMPKMATQVITGEEK